MNTRIVQWLSVIAISIPAQTINLHGTVSSTAGGPISGAIVSIAKLKLMDTTGADGGYSFGGPTGVLTRGLSGLQLQDGNLSVSLTAPLAGRITVLDLEGKVLARIQTPVLAAGIHSLPLPAISSKSLLVVQASFGDQTMLVRTLPLATGRFADGSPLLVGSATAARALATVDTLTVGAKGYLSKSVPLSSYEQVQDVSLSPVATCNPADKTGDPVSVNVSNSGSALTGTHQVVVETDPSLAGRTIYRPKDLAPGAKYPILIWGNGGCSLNATDHTDFHLEIASHGYVIISDGTPKGTGNRDMVDVTTLGAPQIAALSWGIGQNSKACSRFYQALDTVHVAAFGWSCGGLMTVGASIDKRIFTSIIMSSGLLSPDQTTLDKIHAPIAYVCGGSSDIAYDNCTRDYTNMKTVPAILANDPVGHGGTYYSDNGGEFAKIAIAWFDWWLKEDASVKSKFVAPDGQFSKSPWTLQTKRLP